MRTLAAAGAAATTTLGLLLAVVPQVRADSDCQLAFERWARLSSAQVRSVPQSEGSMPSGRGACVATEAARSDLLDGLTRARALCGDSTSDQSLQQTRTLININQSFIAALEVCQSASAEPGAGWATKAAPTAPPPAPPKAAAVTPPAAAPGPAAAPLPTPPCLQVSPGQNDSFAFVNQRCRGHTVLAVIETRDVSGETACKGYEINQTLSVRSSKTAPRLNYECVSSQGQCNKDRLGDMFPECDW